MMKMECNEGCGEEFVLISYGKEEVLPKVNRVGFSCPHCGHVYTAYYENEKVRTFNALLTVLMQRPGKGGLTKRQVQGIDVRISNTKKKLDAEMKRLKTMVESKNKA
ncbi:hypothetical protein [Paenibacillus sp. 7516]|uniref:hypothetical protein n=1 Tax=Paenibacillus sp. 7516 TaxID=2022549 RepID=UPI000BA5106E|nr:hypothetical protein [Paenibacillus sp. 7516]PAF31857.1 hypothetical protein CHI14_09390 [Paenibacillus sp. 7516]